MQHAFDWGRAAPSEAALSVFADTLERRTQEAVASGDAVALARFGGDDEGWRASAEELAALMRLDAAAVARRRGGLGAAGAPAFLRLPDLLRSLAQDDEDCAMGGGVGSAQGPPLYLAAVLAALRWGGGGGGPSQHAAVGGGDELVEAVAAELRPVPRVFLDMPRREQEAAGLPALVRSLHGVVAPLRHEADVTVVQGSGGSEQDGDEAPAMCRLVELLENEVDFVLSPHSSLLVSSAVPERKRAIWRQIVARGLAVGCVHVKGTPPSHDRWVLLAEDARGTRASAAEAMRANAAVVAAAVEAAGASGGASVSVTPAFLHAARAHCEWPEALDFDERRGGGSGGGGDLVWHAAAPVLALVPPLRDVEWEDDSGDEAEENARALHTLHAAVRGARRGAEEGRAKGGAGVVVMPLHATWYRPGRVHAVEAEDEVLRETVLDAWYVETRDWMVRLHRGSPREYLTFVSAKRRISGPDNKLLAVWQFLSKWGLLNYQMAPRGTVRELVPWSSTAEQQESQPPPAQRRRTNDPAQDRSLLADAASSRTCRSFAGSCAGRGGDGDSRECFQRFMQMELRGGGGGGGATDDASAAPPLPAPDAADDESAQQTLEGRLLSFVADTLPPDVATAALEAAGCGGEAGAPTVGGLAAAALGALRAKAAYAAEEEAQRVRQVLQRLAYLQLAALGHYAACARGLEEAAAALREALSVQEVVAAATAEQALRERKGKMMMSGANVWGAVGDAGAGGTDGGHDSGRGEGTGQEQGAPWKGRFKPLNFPVSM